MLNSADLIVLVVYLAAVVGLGLWFAGRSRDTEAFMAADRSLPGWAIGLSMFGSYISSISFLANPEDAYVGNWNAFVFSIATPIAAAVAVRWFVPFFRASGEISAYEHFEHRFGAWARTYAVICFLLTQMARTGVVVFLLAMAVAPLTGWHVATTITIIGTLMTIYTMAGGIQAVVWVGVLQSLVLIAGPIVCVATILMKTSGGLTEIVHSAAAENKFSLGSFSPSLTEVAQFAQLNPDQRELPSVPTFWLVFIFGLVTHLSNFGVDQSYVQRYITARTDREASKSVWITTLLYVPVAAVFFFIGTGLWVFYRERPELLGSITDTKQIFPHFIATELPTGMAGLVVAAIFAASMDPNLNSMATLTLCDIYKRYFRPNAGERESMFVLRTSTLFWGALGTGIALLLIKTGDTVLKNWWNLASIFSGGVLGLFLLGLVSRRADRTAAATGVTLGVLVTIWMALPKLVDVPESLRNPMHTHMTIVVATLTIFLAGLTVTQLRARR